MRKETRQAVKEMKVELALTATEVDEIVDLLYHLGRIEFEAHRTATSQSVDKLTEYHTNDTRPLKGLTWSHPEDSTK